MNMIRDRVVIITGASSGIGAATVRLLARHGAKVVLAARRAAEIEALAADINRSGGQALAVPTDVSAPAEIDRMVEQTLERFGRVDVLINNAGIGAKRAIADSDDETMERVIDVNLLAPARCTRAVLPAMRRQGGGTIVNIGSVAGEVATSGVYSATKFGLRGLSDSLRRELRHDNIAVVLIVPGLIRTPMTGGMDLPMPGPEVVARAVARAITHRPRRIIVPWAYGPMIYLAKFLPWLADIMIGSRLFQRQSRRRASTQ
jgi:NAD(P)-dependent dehydrogenase (short-subunit alcohol dehydrogenase family)